MSGYETSAIQSALDVYPDTTAEDQPQAVTVDPTLQLTQLLNISAYLVSVMDLDELLMRVVTQVVVALPRCKAASSGSMSGDRVDYGSLPVMDCRSSQPPMLISNTVNWHRARVRLVSHSREMK